MLPFLKPEKQTGVMMAVTKPKGGVEDEGMEGEPNHAVLSIAEDLIRAVHSKDTHAVASCLEDAFEILGDKGEPEEPESQEGSI